jgi:hypothetical protein
MSALARTFLACIFTAHLVLAAAWWWLMPGGFPVAHVRFWSNQVLPLVVVAVAGAYVWARYRNHAGAQRTLALSVAAFWFAAGVSSRVIFPITMEVLWLAPLLGAMYVALVAIRPLRFDATAIVACTFATLLGVFVPLTQRGADPSTRPLNINFEPVEAAGDLSAGVIRVNESVRVQPNGGVVAVACGAVQLDVEPLLTFISRSPDRCWTLLASPRDRVGPPRRLIADESTGEKVVLRFADDGQSRLMVSRTPDPRITEIEATSRLDSPFYSHLNSYCTITSIGHKRLELAFSPCPDVRVEVTPFDYPFGRPVRFAYLDSSETFRVVEARSAEKGPFRTLASGKLKRGEPLTITLLDQGEPVARVTLDDWSVQLSTALSPTAGWGVPQNAITFILSGSSATSPAMLSVELAGTGIGRGYDSVGHAAGVYRNRMCVERLDERQGR